MSNIITDPASLNGLIRVMQDQILEKEQEIVKLRTSIVRSEQLIYHIRKTGTYENPSANMKDKEMKEYWKRIRITI